MRHRRRRDRPTITMLYHFDDREQAEPVRQLGIRRQRLVDSTRVITISDFCRREALRTGVPESRIDVARPGLDRVQFRVAERSSHGGNLPAEKYLLSVSNLVPHKGYEFLVRAVEQCRVRDFKVVIVGSADINPAYSASLRAMIARAGLEQRIVLAGRVSAQALNDYYAGAAGFVFPSLMEGYGMAVAEAMQFGLPVIATAVGAIPELVDVHCGCLVQPRDAEELARAMDRLWADDEGRARFAAAARARAQEILGKGGAERLFHARVMVGPGERYQNQHAVAARTAA